MKYVSIVDAKDRLADLVEFLHDDPHAEVYLTFNNKPVVKMTSVTEDLPPVEKPNPNRRRFGIAKGKFTFDDELFDALDADIKAM
ncbi:MAG: type II toxin-antitoxin system Phd/YefM family antitoxin [Selenomonadaceae bacterium]|nr:type II toxin-antitoxin system Phd/YefM family antitoxin [Selenomonadaceae bacterium]